MHYTQYMTHDLWPTNYLWRRTRDSFTHSPPMWFSLALQHVKKIFLIVFSLDLECVFSLLRLKKGCVQEKFFFMNLVRLKYTVCCRTYLLKRLWLFIMVNSNKSLVFRLSHDVVTCFDCILLVFYRRCDDRSWLTDSCSCHFEPLDWNDIYITYILFVDR